VNGSDLLAKQERDYASRDCETEHEPDDGLDLGVGTDERPVDQGQQRNENYRGEPAIDGDEVHGQCRIERHVAKYVPEHRDGEVGDYRDEEDDHAARDDSPQSK